MKFNHFTLIFSLAGNLSKNNDNYMNAKDIYVKNKIHINKAAQRQIIFKV